MEQLDFSRYLGRLWRAGIREGVRHLIAHAIRTLGLAAGFAWIGYEAGSALPHAAWSGLVGSLVGVIVGLLLSWLWVAVSVGFLVWKEDQAEIGKLQPLTKTAESLLIDELRRLMVPLPGPSMNALQFLMRTDSMLDAIGGGTVEQLANAALEPGEAPWSYGKHDKSTHLFHPFLLGLCERRIIERAPHYTDAHYKWHADGRQLIRRIRAIEGVSQ